jgi:hypothetical protein
VYGLEEADVENSINIWNWFENVRDSLLSHWEAEVVEKSSKFRKGIEEE